VIDWMNFLVIVIKPNIGFFWAAGTALGALETPRF